MYDITSPEHPANIALSVLKSHIGSGGHAWVQSKTSVGSGAWCAATMVATGIDSGLAGIIFPTRNQPTPSGFWSSILCAGGVCECVVKTYGGKRIDGPAWGKQNVVPSPGDLIVFLWDDFRRTVMREYNSGTKGRYWSGSHVGMVEYVECDSSNNPIKVHTIEGNNGGTLQRSSYKINRECIAFYARPNWVKANGVASATYSTTGTYVPEDVEVVSTQLVDGIYSTQLYTTESTKADASIREVAYLGSDGKPCINMTGIRLSVINYTGLLTDLSKLTGSISGTATTDNIDALPTLPRTIVQHLTSNGLNTAAAIGIIANIEAESDFRTNCLGDYKNGVATSFGICQWHNERGKNMIKYVGGGWDNNLTGQLNFLLYELSNSYNKSVYQPLLKVPNTLDGAKSAAEIFVREFEKPGDLIGAIQRRRNAAEKYWNKVVVTTAAQSADYSSTPTVQKAKTGYGDLYLVWPIDSVPVGTYSSGYGYRGYVGVNGATTWHNGVDVGAKSGTPIKCCAPGTIYKKSETSARGYYVVVDHGNKFYTLYQHMLEPCNLSLNTVVVAGQVIGKVGNTGLKNMSPHLHLETHSGGLLQGTGSGSSYRSTSTVNPEQFFPKAGSKN